jgi:hypothetical protein
MKNNDCLSFLQISNNRALSTVSLLRLINAFRFAAVVEINRDEDSVLTAEMQNETNRLVLYRTPKERHIICCV